MNRLIAAVSLLTILSLSTWAQSPPERARFALPQVRTLPASGSWSHVTYDVQQQRISSIRKGPAGTQALGTPPCFDNSTPTFDFLLAFVVANPGEELVDWGVKRCSESGLLRSFTVSYCSLAIPVDSGGPGATLSIALYDGTAGFGRLGTEVFRHTVSGLPTSHATLTFDFGNHPLALSDGNIGWSAFQIDADTGPLLIRAPDPFNGTADALDLYSGPASSGTYLGTFNYGGCQANPGVPCASLFMQMDEIPSDQLAGSILRNGTGVNPVLLSELLPARLGQVWVGRIDLAGQPVGTMTLLAASTAPLAPRLFPFGEMLIDPAHIFAGPLAGSGHYFFPVPTDATLAGLHVFVQGAVQPPSGLFLTNALRVTLGY